MRMFMLPSSFNHDHEITVSGKNYHYLIHVLRYQSGAVFSGRAVDGSLWQLLLSSFNEKEKSCTLTCTPAHDIPGTLFPASPLPEIHVYQSILKGKKMDVLIRQLVEIGITRFIPVQTQYSVVQLLNKEHGHKHQRWCQIRDEAIQQSGSPVVTTIEQPMSFSEMIEDWNARGLGVFFHHERLHEQTLSDIISEYHGESRPTALLIGCEGGLSDQEVLELKNSGFKPAFLKTNILRAETASVYASACTQMLLQEISQSS